MTDEEVICGWMEKRPSYESGGTGHSARHWWLSNPHHDNWWPTELTLDRLREVEERLTDSQWELYFLAWPGRFLGFRGFVHASAEQKIKALAEVLRKDGRDGR